MTGFFYDPALEEEMSEPDEGRRWPRRLLGLIGLALGLALGLGYAWGLNPVQFYNTDPVDLHPRHKETWILLVAAVYRQDGDLDRAMGRLAGLDDPQIVQSVAELTVRHIRTDQPATRIRALAALADALGARTDEMLAYLSTPQPTPSFTPTPIPPTPTPTPTATPTPTPTATPTPTPTPTPSPTATPATPTPTAPPTLRPTPTGPPPYYLEERQRLCLAGQEPPRIEIVVQTKEGAGIPNSEIWVTWNGGADRFFTGLKPEVGLGYADFDMAMDVVYTIAVDEPTLPVATGLNTRPCVSEDGVSALTSWRLIIVATSSARTPTPTPAPTILPSATAPPTPTPDRTRAIP